MVERLYRPREVAEMLGVSAKKAQEIMRWQMRHVPLNGPDAKHSFVAVTLSEIERWQKRSTVEPERREALPCSPKPSRKSTKWRQEAVPDRIPRRKLCNERIDMRKPVVSKTVEE